MGEALAARAPAEDDDPAAEKPGARRQRNRGVAAQPRAVEEDRLGRQVFEPGALSTDRSCAIPVVAPVER